MKHLKVIKENCIGCRLCEIACAASRYSEFNYKRARLKAPESFPLPMPPVFCKHCKKPFCIEACPNNSLSLNDDGMVELNEQTCTKCMECQKACPFSAVFQDVITGFPLICDVCGECVQFCPTNALQVVE